MAERKYIVEAVGRKSKPVTKDQVRNQFDAGKIPRNARVRPIGSASQIPLLDFLGVTATHAPVRIAAPEVVRRRANTCPFCAERIRRNARKCKHCGELLDPTLRPGIDARARQLAVVPPELTQPRLDPGTSQSARPLIRTIWAVLTLLAVAAVVAISGHLFYTETVGTYDPETHTILFNGRRIGPVTYLIVACGMRATLWCGAPWLLATVALGAFYAAARPER